MIASYCAVQGMHAEYLQTVFPLQFQVPMVYIIPAWTFSQLVLVAKVWETLPGWQKGLRRLLAVALLAVEWRAAWARIL